MKLAAYLDVHKMTQDEFGRLIGQSQPSVSRYVTGLRIPDADAMRAIATATMGEVLPNDFFEGIT